MFVDVVQCVCELFFVDVVFVEEQYGGLGWCDVFDYVVDCVEVGGNVDQIDLVVGVVGDGVVVIEGEGFVVWGLYEILGLQVVCIGFWIVLLVECFVDDFVGGMFYVFVFDFVDQYLVVEKVVQVIIGIFLLYLVYW